MSWTTFCGMTTSETTDVQLRQALIGLAAAATATGALTAAALATAASAAGTPPTDIKAYKPVADAYVSSQQPRTNFGRAAVLRVDGMPETTTYLRFKLRNLGPDVTSVTLLLHPKSGGKGSFAVRGAGTRKWAERRLTFANAPSPSARYTAAKPVSRGVWSAIDVTAFVEDSGEVNLAVTTRAAQGLSFGSRESRQGPRLVVRSDELELDELVLGALLDDRP